MRALIEPCADLGGKLPGGFALRPDSGRAPGYAGICSVETFVYEPDGPTCAARAIGFLQGLLQGREES